MAKPKTSFHIPSGFAQVASEFMSWTLFLVMLGELAWSASDKKRILSFYGIKD
tara:strand:- start:22019 stop:22177 length:159 start_codon:yes stop_codon:yes gene_type:complete